MEKGRITRREARKKLDSLRLSDFNRYSLITDR